LDRGLSSFWRTQRQFDTRVPEDKIRGREFLQPNTGFAAGIAQLIVRRQHHQYFHVRSRSFLYYGQLSVRKSRTTTKP
jgi:hypothetical protein